MLCQVVKKVSLVWIINITVVTIALKMCWVIYQSGKRMVRFKKNFIFKQIQNLLFRWVIWPAGLLFIKIQIPVKEIQLKLIKGKYPRYIYWRLIIFHFKQVRNKNFSRLFIIWNVYFFLQFGTQSEYIAQFVSVIIGLFYDWCNEKSP